MRERMPPCRRRWRAGEWGSGLPMALMAAALLSSLGSALVLLAVTESAIASSYRRDMQVSYAVESALARVHTDLDALPDWAAATAGLMTSTLTDGDPAAVRMIGDSVVDLRALTTALNASDAPDPWPPDRPSQWHLFAWAPADVLSGAVTTPPCYVAVWIHELPDQGDPDDAGGRIPAIRLHAQAYGPAGARRQGVMTLVRQPGRPAEMRSWHEVR